MATKIVVTGKTYAARGLLSQCGFVWSATCWTGDEFALSEIVRRGTSRYSKDNAMLVRWLKIVREVSA